VLDGAVARPGTTSAAEVELEAASGAVLSLGAVATWDGRG
jgi:hypothetical protein